MSSVSARPRHLTLGSVLVVLAAGCASSSGSHTKVHTTSTDPEQRFSMVGSGLQTTAVISKSGAQGPTINVGRFDDGRTIRGTAEGRPVEITVTEGRASGSWASGPINVNVLEEGDQLKMNGLVAGRPSTWTVSGEALQGTIGFCAYDLRRQGDAYVGSRSCGRGIGQVNVQFPSTIADWDPINIGVLMALLMATP